MKGVRQRLLIGAFLLASLFLVIQIFDGQGQGWNEQSQERPLLAPNVLTPEESWARNTIAFLQTNEYEYLTGMQNPHYINKICINLWDQVPSDFGVSIVEFLNSDEFSEALTHAVIIERNNLDQLIKARMSLGSDAESAKRVAEFGDSFAVTLIGTPTAFYSPEGEGSIHLVPRYSEALGNGCYRFLFTVRDAGNYEISVHHTAFAFGGILGPNVDYDYFEPGGHGNIISDQEDNRLCPPASFRRPIQHNAKLTIQNSEEDLEKIESNLPYCETGIQSGRWVGLDWKAFDCRYRHYTHAEMVQCAKDRGKRVLLVGDSIMRGLFFDMADVLTEVENDRSWGKGEHEIYMQRENFELYFYWWSIQSDDREGNLASAIDRAKTHFNASHFDTIAVNVNIWAAKELNSTTFLSSVQTMLASIDVPTPKGAPPIQYIWRTGTTAHRYSWGSPCSDNCMSYRFMNKDRIDGFSRAAWGTVLEYPFRHLDGMTVVDMLSLSMGRPDLANNEHFDKMYIQPGYISMVTANILLNAICNESF